MNHEMHPHVKYDRIKQLTDADCTRIDLRKRIDPRVWDKVIASAKILQETNDVPFEKGDVVFHPGIGKLLEITHVYDNRHRAAFGAVTLECRSGNHVQYLQAGTVLHFGYLLDANDPYDPNVFTVYADSADDMLKGLTAAIQHFGITK